VGALIGAGAVGETDPIEARVKACTVEVHGLEGGQPGSGFFVAPYLVATCAHVAGGAVSPRQFALCYPGIEIDVVEPEPHVIELSRKFYGLDEIPRPNRSRDGREIVPRNGI
jgi:hypothetical protein